MVFLSKTKLRLNSGRFITTAALIFFSSIFNKAQVTQDAWVLGFGLQAPKVSVTPSGLGGYASIQRNFSEHVGLRLSANYGDFREEWAEGEVTSTKSFYSNLDFVYYFSPCEWFSPFLTGGVGLNFYKVENAEDVDITDENRTASQFGIGVGSEIDLGKDWKIKAEGGFYTLMTSNFDGNWGAEGGGIFGTSTDSFLKLDLGVQWYFSKGEPSKICQLYSGIEQQDNFDYEKFEKTIEQNIPKKLISEKIVIKDVPQKNDKLILLGVGFKFNSSKLTHDSYPVLYHVSKILKENPNLKIEIEGHCDSIGTTAVNQRISQQRADVIKLYLLERDIDENRISAVGYGSSKPIAENNTPEGRAMNRRIEFKVVK